ncbi:hypothetical protein [Pseudoalteromonas sp.]|uniref:hypothetical protein n=1 Tax=Pseudoalteromonas sp. TaxID=53249 RepID=UPI002729B830|nr:hypothetical protein [Pseudoalteromonas sp.]
MTTLNLMDNGKPLTLDITKLSGAQLTAFRILTMLGEFKLDMQTFCSVNPMKKRPEPRCGTTFCLLGWLAFVDNYPDKFKEYDVDEELIGFDFRAYADVLLNQDKVMYHFLFDGDWPSDWELAERRAHHVLLHGTFPDIDTWVREWGLPRKAELAKEENKNWLKSFLN